MSILDNALKYCRGRSFVYKFISANDVGLTGAHQAGLYMPKKSWPLFFDHAGVKGKSRDLEISVTWNDELETQSRYIWYGRGTRSEYRMTRFGRDFPLLKDDNVGSLFLMTKDEDTGYRAYILDADEDIDEFIAAFKISPLVRADVVNAGEEGERWHPSPQNLFDQYIRTLDVDFPSTVEMSETAQQICSQLCKCSGSDPDACLVRWMKMEYDLFKYIENERYSRRIVEPFHDVEELLEFANTILNRRKSRAGASLENHLGSIFNECHLLFSHGKKTEGNKKPDFIFPGIDSYRNRSYPAENLVFLGAKTTCKDRWRQVLNEADRIDQKHLFTLQPGISQNQLSEMENAGVQLVVPKENRGCFPEKYRKKLMCLDDFIHLVKTKTGTDSVQCRIPEC